jgi:hypothetical protein
MAWEKPFHNHAAIIAANSSIILAACLAFSVPFGPSRNTDMQGILLIISGVLAWLSLLIERDLVWPFTKFRSLLLGLFFTGCLLATFLQPHFGYNFWGAPYIRLGVAGFLACFGIALLTLRLKVGFLIRTTYLLIIGMVFLSLPYTWFKLHNLQRIGGVFAQADIFAVFLACGLLLGDYLASVADTNWRRKIIGLQILLAIMLILTATRSALLLTLLLYPIARQLGPKPLRIKSLVICIALIVLLIVTASSVLPNRVKNGDYAAQSISYRLNLQAAAFRAADHKPLGYGPGNLADALDCRRLKTTDLKQTCSEGYFFNSSHNIFLDRVVAVGWLSGGALLLFIILSLIKGLKTKSPIRHLSLAALLISLYYLTNVTAVTLELLLWVLVIQTYRISRVLA